MGIKLSLSTQQENLAHALTEHGIAFEPYGNSIVIRFSMKRPQYLEILERINATVHELWESGKMYKGEINYVRGLDLNENLQPVQGRELIVFHFGPQEEFDRLREGTYPAPWFKSQSTERK